MILAWDFVFCGFRKGVMDGPTDGPTDGWNDGQTDGQTLFWRCEDASKKDDANNI